MSPTAETPPRGNFHGHWTQGPRSRSMIAGRRLLFKGKSPLFLRFTKAKSNTNFFLIKILLAPKRPKQLLEPYVLVLGLLAPSFRACFAPPHPAPASGWGRYAGLQAAHPSGVRRPLRYSSTPTPAPSAALRSRVFLGNEAAPADQRFWWPRPGFRFHLTQSGHLIFASPPGGSHPRPSLAPEEVEPRAFEVWGISILEEPPGPKPVAPAERGQQVRSGGPRKVRIGGGPGRTPLRLLSPPSLLYGIVQAWRLPGHLSSNSPSVSTRFRDNLYDIVITTLLKCPLT